MFSKRKVSGNCTGRVEVLEEIDQKFGRVDQKFGRVEQKFWPCCFTL